MTIDDNIISMWNKKVRGQRRKLKVLLKTIEHPTAPFEREGQCIELSVPSTPWIEMPKTYGKVKTEFCRKWIEETAILADSIPEDAGFCKVVGSIVYPQLWNSTILIFRDEEYYNSFWKRDDAYQIWTPIEGKSFIRERNIKTDLNEFGFEEVLKDEDFEFHCRIWFYTKDDLPLN